MLGLLWPLGGNQVGDSNVHGSILKLMSIIVMMSGAELGLKLKKGCARVVLFVRNAHEGLFSDCLDCVYMGPHDLGPGDSALFRKLLNGLYKKMAKTKAYLDQTWVKTFIEAYVLNMSLQPLFCGSRMALRESFSGPTHYFKY